MKKKQDKLSLYFSGFLFNGIIYKIVKLKNRSLNLRIKKKFFLKAADRSFIKRLIRVYIFKYINLTNFSFILLFANEEKSFSIFLFL